MLRIVFLVTRSIASGNAIFAFPSPILHRPYIHPSLIPDSAMPIDRQEAIEILEEIALLLELKGENTFKIRAYENAARTLATLDGDFAHLVLSGELSNVKGFGSALMEKLTELVQTGRLSYLERLREEFPASLRDLLAIPGVGPKKVKLFYQTLRITNVGELEIACRDGRVASLPGLGEKTAQKILQGIVRSREFAAFFLYEDALTTALEVVESLRKLPQIQRLELAGSLRRYKEFTKDIDIVASATTEASAEVMAQFVALPRVRSVLGHGATKSTVILDNGIQADLRLVEDAIFPCALHHFTGSKEHNVAIRSRALERGLKVSEWGLFRLQSDGDPIRIPCADEAELYQQLGLRFIPPELREDRGEIEHAAQADFPRLVEYGDYQGVLHCHSRASDGVDRIEDLVDYARALGHRYLGITDHSKSSFQANGLSEERLLGQVAHIRTLNSAYGRDWRLFSGVECDIHIDGSLDYTDDVLGQLDFVIVSIHSAFSRPKAEMTRRLVKAIEHPATRIVGHLTGRLLLQRDGYEVDVDTIIDAAAANRVAIELNCNPMRLDMDWRFWRKAKDKGVVCSLNPDAHARSHFGFIKSGIGFCRKGWLEAENIINCWPPQRVAEFFARR